MINQIFLLVQHTHCASFFSDNFLSYCFMPDKNLHCLKLRVAIDTVKKLLLLLRYSAPQHVFSIHPYAFPKTYQITLFNLTFSCGTKITHCFNQCAKLCIFDHNTKLKLREAIKFEKREFCERKK